MRMEQHVPILTTARLRLIPATVELARAELEDRSTFAALLQAAIPPNWPPETLVDALPWFLHQLETQPDHAGWLAWYGLLVDPPLLVASGGFMGPPRDGIVEVGYAVLPQFQKNGFATEMVAELARWAFAEPEVRHIVAETDAANTASIRVLHKLGFSRTVADGSTLRFELIKVDTVLS